MYVKSSFTSNLSIAYISYDLFCKLLNSYNTFEKYLLLKYKDFEFECMNMTIYFLICKISRTEYDTSINLMNSNNIDIRRKF